MKFKFQLHEGKVSFLNWIVLCFYAVSILIVRFLRLAKRVIVYLRRYIPILFCIILFESIIIPVGIHLEKYTSWIDGVWDLRNFFFTSVLISFVGGILKEEYKRHKVLVKQFDVYQAFMFESEQFIDKLCLLMNVDYNETIFLNENQYEKYLSCVRAKIEECSKNAITKIDKLPMVRNTYVVYSTPRVKPRVYLKIAVERYLRVIDNLSRCIQQSEFIGIMDHAVSQLDAIYEQIQNELFQIEADGDNYTNVQLLKFTECVVRCIYPAVADIRRPWRWDIEKNNTMRKLLEN